MNVQPTYKAKPMEFRRTSVGNQQKNERDPKAITKTNQEHLMNVQWETNGKSKEDQMEIQGTYEENTMKLPGKGNEHAMKT